MVHLICDKCGKDCDLCAYDIQIGSLHNPVPKRLTDTSRAQLTCDKETVRFVLCQECYAEHGLPNIWSTLSENKLVFDIDKRKEEYYV